MARKKAKKAKKKAAEEVYFIKLEQPNDVYKSLLETAHAYLQILKKYELLKEKKEKRKEKTAAFLSILDEIKSLVNQINKLLPKSDVKPSISPMATKIPEIKPSKPTKAQTELEKLESELASIEQKLAN